MMPSNPYQPPHGRAPDERPRDSPWSWTRVLAPGCILGAIAAVLTMLTAWQHNPQSEFWSEDGVDWLALGSVGAAWFTIVAVPVTAVALLVALLRWARWH
jgi:hypothetical protein